MLKVAVCDDEKYYLDEAGKIISAFFSDDNADVYFFENKSDFDKIFDSSDTFFDIVIMDIEMPDINGIEFAEYIRSKNERTRIIFLTNYPEYATEVYDTEPTFYVLKKDADTRLPAALNKAVKQLDRIQNDIITVDVLHQGLSVLEINDIIYFERSKRTTVIYTLDGTVQTTADFGELSKLFKSGIITRIYRSYMINLRHLKSIVGENVVLTNGVSLPVSRNYSKNLKEDFMHYIKNIHR